MNGEMPRLDEKALEALAALIYPSFDLTEEERETIRAFVEKKVSGYDPRRALRMWILKHPAVPSAFRSFSRVAQEDWRMVAARQTRATRVAIAGDVIELVYASLTVPLSKDMWRATLKLPANPTSDSMIELEISDGFGSPAEGLFAVSGICVPVTGGAARMEYVKFVEGIKNSKVYLERADGRKVYGTLVLV